MALYAFDGTWNDSSDPDGQRDVKKDTNVHRFRCLYEGEVFYESGVGTRFGVIGKMLGGITGMGAIDRIVDQFSALKKQFKSGDTTIDIVGYSRGAAIARMFVHKLAEDYDKLEVGGERLTAPPEVRFLGLFDTVASFGAAWTNNEHNFEAEIPEFVENTFHAMALDEVRETFGIERCVGNRNRITEVWFRGGHGDIGGNATYVDRYEPVSNRQRSDIALNWMLRKAKCVGLPVADSVEKAYLESISNDAPVTAEEELISVGNAGTLSRRLHVGDLVHHTVEQTELTRGVSGLLLRRITTMTRIEDKRLEASADAIHWIAPSGPESFPDNERVDENHPSLVNLSLRRYPFDVPPARTWAAWLDLWDIGISDFDEDYLAEFWAPTDADKALAWDIYIELQTRITVQELKDDEGDDLAALTSVYKLFPLTRESLRKHGVDCSNAGLLITTFLNQKVRPFTAEWHKRSLDENWKENKKIDLEFREALRDVQKSLGKLTSALSQLADVRL